MFECNYKFTIQDASKCARYVFKSQRGGKERFLAIAVPMLLLVMVGLLVFDIVKGRPIIIDIVLIISIAVLLVLTLMLPMFVVRVQRKQYKAQNFDDMDSLKIKINNGICEEAMMKDGKAVLENSHNLKTMVSFIEDDENIILLYNTGEYTCIKKLNLIGDVERLRSVLTKAMKVKTK